MGIVYFQNSFIYGMRKENKIDLWKNIYGTANSKRVCYKHQGGRFSDSKSLG